MPHVSSTRRIPSERSSCVFTLPLSSTSKKLGQPVPAGAVADIWVATEGGYLVALEASGLTGSGNGSFSSINVELTNVNDPSLKVEPPA